MSPEPSYPALFEAADKASAKAQGDFLRALFWNLAALVAAAGLSILNQPSVLFACLQAAVLAAGLGCTLYLGARQPQKIWYGARALAESIKTIAWRYMVRAEPYDLDDAAAAKKFAGDLHDLLKDNREISKHAIPPATSVQVTEFMKEKRSISLADRKKFYISDRIGDQLRWYENKARFNNWRSMFFFLALVLVNFAAIVFALMRIARPDVVYWPTDILIAAAGSIMAWTQAKRFQELSASYALAAHEIAIIQTKVPEGGEREFSLFVGDAENAFSREHVQWLARRDQ